LLTDSGQNINVNSLPFEIAHFSGSVREKKAPTFISQEMIAEDKDLLKGAASKAEYDTIMAVLQQVNFNKKKAAALLNIDRKTLYNKIKNFQALHQSQS
jgi:two-component system response regulator HydG